MSGLSATFEQLGKRAVELEASLHEWFRATVGLRIVDRLGWTRLARGIVAAVWVISLVQVGAIFRPDLLRPADIGSDSSNYVAAAERLAEGQSVYALSPGDRPVPLDNAPDWTVPILSPPTAATSYLPQLVLPGSLRFYPAWALGLAGTVAAGFIAIALGPPLFLLLALQLMPGLAVTAWSGNVNSLIAPVLVIAFWAGRSKSARLHVVAGVIVGVAICVKIGPAAVAWWLVSQSRRIAGAAVASTVAVIVALTLTLGGLAAFSDYVDVVRTAAVTPANVSIPGLLQSWGVSPPAATAALVGFLVASAALIVVLRREPASFLLATIATVFATTVVRFDSIGLIVIGGIAWEGRGILVPPLPVSEGQMTRPQAVRGRRIAPVSAVAGVLAAAVAVAVSLTTGGLDRSSLAVTNSTDSPMIVRLTVPGQKASFGYEIPPHASVSGWSTTPGGSPPDVWIWSQGCSLVSRASLPRVGGEVLATGGGIAVTADTETGSPAPYVATCADDLKRLRYPSGVTTSSSAE